MVAHTHLEFEHLHQPSGWLSPGYLEIDAHGDIAEVAAARPLHWPNSARRVAGYAIPGLPNLHSHAFQRAFAGFAEHRSHATDTFWTWREAMYACADAIDPDALEDITAMAFLEMLRAGYTSVAEFHYLHHDKTGLPFSDRAEASWRILSAATRVGLGLTLLPVFYQRGGFDQPLQARQRRFAHRTVDEFFATCGRVLARMRGERIWRFGAAAHSLRAVEERALHDVVAALDHHDPSAPIHIHVAEQQREVDDCLANLDARPVAYLLSRFNLGPRWCLVHATHVDDGERLALARSDAVAGLCPTTEANLGDGIFPADTFMGTAGRVGVGSDSQIEIDPCAELRLLEYGQRLRREERNVLVGEGTGHVGRHLWQSACAGGAQALGQAVGELRPGRRADIVGLDPQHPRLLGHSPDTVLDAFVFAAGAGAVRDVWVGGRHLVHDRHHHAEEEICASFRRTMHRLYQRA
ncbi:MAG: formimidoylglutamate deiminase [Planctomycetota bacterium]